MLHLRFSVQLEQVEVTVLVPVPPSVIAHLPQMDRWVEKEEPSWVFSGPELDVSLSRAPLHKFHFPAGMRGRVQGDAWSPPQHLLLEFNDVVAEVRHHQQEEVERAGWSLPRQEDTSVRRSRTAAKIWFH